MPSPVMPQPVPLSDELLYANVDRLQHKIALITGEGFNSIMSPRLTGENKEPVAGSESMRL